jgi:hypothetical protein
MKAYWQKNREVTFAYYAVIREFKKAILKKNISEAERNRFIDNYKKVRFSIYKYAMLNLFPPAYFSQYQDVKNCVYVLLNKKQKKPVTTLKQLAKYLLDYHELIFEPQLIA